MADNEPPDPATPDRDAARDADVPAVLPPGMDADEYRKFQEFQRFQEYQRFVEAQGRSGTPGGELVPLPPPGQPGPYGPPHPPVPYGQQWPAPPPAGPPRTPLWLLVLRSRLVRRLISLALLLVALYVAYQHFFGTDPTNPAALHPGPIEGSGRLEPNPKDAVAAVYHQVADNPPDNACLEFTPAGAQAFARDFGATDCKQAVNRLHAALTSGGRSAYGVVVVFDAAVTRTGNTAVISSCRMRIDDGPRLGAFVLTENADGEWQITGHRAEPDPCPAPPSGTDAGQPPTTGASAPPTS